MTKPNIDDRGGAAGGPSAARDRILGSALLVAPAVIVLAVKLVTSREDLLTIGADLGVYAGYAGRLLGGAIPYRDFHLEYPPLALVAMAIPRLASVAGPPDLEAYSWLFTSVAAGLALAGGLLLAALVRRPIGVLATWSLLVAATALSIAWRYDVWPAILVLAAVVATQRRRPFAAGLAIGIGTMMKLFPIVLLPVLVLRALAMNDRRAVLRLCAATGTVIVAVLVVSVIAAGPAAFQWLSYQLDRGLQLETTGAGVILLGHAVEHTPVTVSNSFQSMQVQGPGAELFVALSSWLELVLVGIVLAATAVRFRSDVRSRGAIEPPTLAAAAIAVILAVIVPSKVFSAQYVVWFLPLVPLLPVPKRLLGIAIAALSTFIYPFNYTALWRLDPALAGILDLRNLLLVAFLVWLAVDLRRGSEPGEASSTASPLLVAGSAADG